MPQDGRKPYVRVDPDGNAYAGPALLPRVGFGAPGEQFTLACHQRRAVFHRVAERADRPAHRLGRVGQHERYERLIAVGKALLAP